jgi:hypothetical protein
VKAEKKKKKKENNDDDDNDGGDDGSDDFIDMNKISKGGSCCFNFSLCCDIIIAACWMLTQKLIQSLYSDILYSVDNKDKKKRGKEKEKRKDWLESLCGRNAQKHIVKFKCSTLEKDEEKEKKEEEKMVLEREEDVMKKEEEEGLEKLIKEKNILIFDNNVTDIFSVNSSSSLSATDYSTLPITSSSFEKPPPSNQTASLSASLASCSSSFSSSFPSSSSSSSSSFSSPPPFIPSGKTFTPFPCIPFVLSPSPLVRLFFSNLKRGKRSSPWIWSLYDWSFNCFISMAFLELRIFLNHYFQDMKKENHLTGFFFFFYGYVFLFTYQEEDDKLTDLHFHLTQIMMLRLKLVISYDLVCLFLYLLFSDKGLNLLYEKYPEEKIVVCRNELIKKFFEKLVFTSKQKIRIHLIFIYCFDPSKFF